MKAAEGNTGANFEPGAAMSEHQISMIEANKDRYIEIWKKAVETQMHFNEMSGKSRQLGLTFVAAALGVAVVMLAKGDDFALTMASWKVHVAVLLILAAALALWGVRRLDLDVYHRMLRGAVTFGEDFEKNYMNKIFDLEKGMTGAISHFSRYEDAEVEKDVDRYRYKGKSQKTAEKKIRKFYRDTMFFLLISSIVLFVITNFGTISTTYDKWADGDPVVERPSRADNADILNSNVLNSNLNNKK